MRGFDDMTPPHAPAGISAMGSYYAREIPHRKPSTTGAINALPTEPTRGTVKRLFAISKNRCAFPNCTEPLVTTDGVVTGQICHIRAQSADGPRYDPQQSDEERHGFDNLVLMCPAHHKRVDERAVDYSVDALHEIKRRHESGAPGTEPSDEVAAQLLRNSGFAGDVTQTASDRGMNIAAAGHATVVVQSGLTYAEARDVALDVYRANALELSGEAARIARERVDLLVNGFLESLRQKHETPPASLADPDMQGALFEAQRTAARVGDPRVADVLVDLLVDRACAPTRDLKQIVLNEAIATVGKLTLTQFDALTIIFVLKYTRSFGVRDLTGLSGYLDRVIGPFLATAARSRASFQHMEYAGCGTSGIGSADLWGLLGRTYPHCFVGPVQVSEVEAVRTGGSIDRLVQIGLFERRGDQELQVRPVFDKQAEDQFPALGLDPTSVERLWQMLRSKVVVAEVAESVRGAYSRAAEVEAWWKELPAHFQLTSVGIAIAHANLRRRGIEGFDLSIWIN